MLFHLFLVAVVFNTLSINFEGDNDSNKASVDGKQSALLTADKAKELEKKIAKVRLNPFWGPRQTVLIQIRRHRTWRLIRSSVFIFAYRNFYKNKIKIKK